MRTGQGGVEKATNVLGCKAIGGSESFNVVSVVGKRMYFICGEIERSQVRVSFNRRFFVGSWFFGGS